MIAFVHGPDRLLAREAARALAAEIDPDGSNTTWIDARESGRDHVLAAVGAASFLGAPRVVIASNLLGRASRDADDQSAARAKGADSEIKTLLAAVPGGNCLILFEPEMDAPPAAIKSADPPVTIAAGDPPRGAALIAWIEEAAGRAGARIDRSTAQLLAETLFPQTWDRKPANPRYDRPPNLALLSQEIEKLALAAHPDPISREHVLAHVPSGPDQRLFRFLDAATSGNLRAAQGELERLMAAGEEPAMLLAQVLGQLELMAVASEATGRDAGSVARDLGSITPSRMSAVANAARARRLPAGHSLDVGATIDRKLKTGRIRRPEEALHHLLLALAAPSSSDGPGRSR